MENEGTLSGCGARTRGRGVACATPWTVEGRAALLVDSLDGAVAASCFTSFAFAAVHVKLVGEIAEIAVGMCEVIQARTTRRDGFLEDCSGSID